MASRHDEMKELVRKKLEKTLISRNTHEYVIPNGKVGLWSFDMRPALLDGTTLDYLTELVWDLLDKDLPYQIGGLETAAIVLVSGILQKAAAKGTKMTGFYVRKSRRKDGLQQQIEGNLSDEKIVLIDDGINSGRSFMRQITALEAQGKKVHALVALIRYREESFYSFFTDNGIKLYSLFTLDDFPETGGIRQATAAQPLPQPQPRFDIQWKFSSPTPILFHVVPKSAPLTDNRRVYFGSDGGVFWALNHTDASVAWNYQTLFGAGKKRIFSSPALLNDHVYFGAYDGNMYACETATGRRAWVYREADWIGSSPCIDEQSQSVLVGLEFGLWKKQGGLACLDARTGSKKWWVPIEALVHSSPVVSSKHRVAVVGSNNGIVTAVHMKNGSIAWTFDAKGAVRGGFAVQEEQGLICFGSADHCVYIVRITNGTLVYRFETLEPIYTTPLIRGSYAYFGLLDKRIVCIDMLTGMLAWEYWTHARVFATPVIIDNILFVGSNDGRLYELDPLTGEELGYTQFTERIVNAIAYDRPSQRFFVPTYANELYCLTRTKDFIGSSEPDDISLTR